MEASKRKAARNAAKVEFLANAEEVMSMLGKGFNKFNIYSALCEKGCLTMSYRSFCWNLQQFRNPEKEKRKTGKPITPKTLASTPLRPVQKKEGFGQLEDVDVNSLI